MNDMTRPALIPVRPRDSDIPLVAVQNDPLTDDFNRISEVLEEYFHTNHLAFGEPSDTFVFCCASSTSTPSGGPKKSRATSAGYAPRYQAPEEADTQGAFELGVDVSVYGDVTEPLLL